MSTTLGKSGSDYRFYIYARELKSEFDLDLDIYGDDHDYNDGAKAMLLSASVALGIDGGYGDVDNYGDVFLKCKETGDVVSATGSESIVANENDQFIVCDDISEYLGNYATFTFTAKNEYSDDDLDNMRPTLAQNYKKIQFKLADPLGEPVRIFERCQMAIIVKPNWKYGAPELS